MTTAIRLGSGDMFDRIADRYDFLNRVMSLGIDQRWRRKTVAALELDRLAEEAPVRVLDLATGTGDLAIRIGRSRPGVHVDGLDPSSRMLAIGERKANGAGLSETVAFVEGSAERLPYADATFDGVTIAFGIRNVPDRALGLREMARVTKKGGRIAILELGEPRKGFMAPFARFHIRSVVPRLGALLSGDREYRYLQESIAAFPAPTDFARLMGDNGIRVLRVEELTFGVCTLFVGEPA